MSHIQQLAISEKRFVFDPSTGQSFIVNREGLEVLIGLKQGKGLAAIVRQLSEEYDLAPMDLERDVTDFVSQLKIFRIIEG